MSRGGRGGARGGSKQLPFVEDPNLRPTTKPSELFPERIVPRASAITSREASQVRYYLSMRTLIHDGPLYTHTTLTSPYSSTSNSTTDALPGSTTEAGAPTRVYGQAQMNQRYGVQNKAAIDPFTAMPRYSTAMLKPPRLLPDLTTRKYDKRYFPSELHGTLDGMDGVHAKRPKATNGGVKSGASEVRNAGGGGSQLEDEEGRKAMKALDELDETEEVDTTKVDADEDIDEEDQDDDYGDEDGGDYDAERYFEDGADDEDADEGAEGGGDDEGTY